MDKAKLRKIDIRNIVYNTFGELIKHKGRNAKENLEIIVAEIQHYFNSNNLSAHSNIIRQYVVEYILELYDVDAFGVQPTFNFKKDEKDIEMVLTDLVEKGKLSKHWL